MTDENDYCWCGTRVRYLQTVSYWLCPAHGPQEHVYGATPLISAPHITQEADHDR